MDVKRIALIGILVVLAFFIFTTLMNRGGEEPVVAPVKTVVEKVDYTAVLTVTDVMRRGDVVSEDDITWMDWPSEALTPAFITEDAADENNSGDGKPLSATIIGSIVSDQILPGEPATLSKFIRAGDAGTLSVLLKPGMRAVTVRISVDTASGGFIQPGDKVDVVLRDTVNSGGEVQSVANTIFSNVTVLAIDQMFRSSSETGAAIPGTTATLELSPADSEDLIASQADGEIALILRGFTRSSAYAPSRAAKKRRGAGDAPPLTVYRSGQAETVLVQER